MEVCTNLSSELDGDIFIKVANVHHPALISCRGALCVTGQSPVGQSVFGDLLDGVWLF